MSDTEMNVMTKVDPHRGNGGGKTLREGEDLQKVLEKGDVVEFTFKAHGLPGDEDDA